MENWKDIPNYEGIYKISSMGRIKSLAREKITRHGTPVKLKEIILKTRLSRTGYVLITLTKKSVAKTFSVHRLVGECFLPIIKGKYCLNHKNAIKHDNRVENLEWCTRKENQKHAVDSGLAKGYKVELHNLDNKEVKTFNSMEQVDYYLKKYRGYVNSNRRRLKKETFIIDNYMFVITKNKLKDNKMNKVRELRKKFTKIKLASMLSVSLNTIDKWEHKVSKPNEQNKEKLEQLYKEVFE